MRRLRLFGVILLLPVLAFSVSAAGCGGKKDSPKKHRSSHTDDDDKDDTTTDGKKDGSGDSDGGSDKTAVASTGWGTLKGQVTLDGPAPEGASFVDKMEKHKDKARCLRGPTHDQTWLIGKGGKKGVQNVVVWLDAGPGRYLKVDTAKKTWKDEVDIDQPFCAFQPRVQAVCPSYWDGKKEVKLQKFVAKNSATIAHNTKWQGGDRTNPGGNPLIPPGGQVTLDLKPDTKTVITLSCTIHDWMRGKVWALDTPYYAITDADGKFEIKNAPAGAEVKLVAWHEAAGFISGLPDGGKVKLKDGEDTEVKFSVRP